MEDMILIKIGLEATRDELIDQLLMNPEKYFSIIVMKGRAVLCLRTCDRRGEDVQVKALDCLAHGGDSDLVSIFGDELNLAVIKRDNCLDNLEGGRYPISSSLRRKISEQPGFIDWITRYVLTEDRCLLISPP